MITMKRDHGFRSHLTNGPRLTAVHPSGSLAILEHQSPERNAGCVRWIGVRLLDLGQPEPHVTVHVTLCMRRLGYRTRAAGKTRREALRCLKRRLSDIVFLTMRSDAAQASPQPRQLTPSTSTGWVRPSQTRHD
jgi:hypothetical protein